MGGRKFQRNSLSSFRQMKTPAHFCAAKRKIQPSGKRKLGTLEFLIWKIIFLKTSATPTEKIAVTWRLARKRN